MAESLGKDLVIRTPQESDLAAADRVFRLAFGTFLKLPNPMDFYGDGDMIRTRWLADPSAAFGAFLVGELIGSNFGTNWGSVGFFGPLTVHPDFWDRGVAKRLLEPAMELFTKWVTTHEGLYTFAASPKHVLCIRKIWILSGFSHRGYVEASRLGPLLEILRQLFLAVDRSRSDKARFPLILSAILGKRPFSQIR